MTGVFRVPGEISTLQEAIDTASVGSKIIVGEGLAPERIVIDKRLNIQFLPSAVITDEGLPVSSDPVIRFTGVYTAPRLEGCTIRVTKSIGGIEVEPGVSFAQLKGVVITSQVSPKPRFGVRALHNKRIFFLGGSQRPVISGFDVGFDSFDGGWLNIEAGSQGGVVFANNRVGIRSVRDKGQIFFNEFRDNEAGIELRGNFHQDVNANRFIGNSIGIIWGLSPTPNPHSDCTSQRVMEFNHPVFEDNGIAILVETEPDVYVPDYTKDPGLGTQWTNMTIDGVVVPNYKTTRSTHVCQP